jgi:hypothetical protein
MNLNLLPSDVAPLMAVIDPDATAAGTASTDWVSLADFVSIMAIALAGTLGTSATFDAKIEEAQDSSGTGAQDLSGKAAAQLTQAGTDQSDKQIIFNVRENDLSEGFTHVRLTLTVGTATSDACGLILGFGAKQEPATDAASVAEIV